MAKYKIKSTNEEPEPYKKGQEYQHKHNLFQTEPRIDEEGRRVDYLIIQAPQGIGEGEIFTPPTLFVATGDNGWIRLVNVGDVDGKYTDLMVCDEYDGKTGKCNWRPYEPGEWLELKKGGLFGFSRYVVDDFDPDNYQKFEIRGDISLTGNIDSLYNGEDRDDPEFVAFEHEYVYTHLFDGIEGGLGISNMLLPTPGLSKGCYEEMFVNSQHLKGTPQIGAEYVAEDSMKHMFADSNLNNPPSIQAREVEKEGMYEMYKNTPITQPAYLPARVLGESCYEGMYVGCNNLRTASALPAKELAERCYARMYKSCPSLTSAGSLTIDKAAKESMYEMYDGSSIKSAGVVSIGEAAESCCEHMYSNCAQLVNGGVMIDITETALACCREMFYNDPLLASVPTLTAMSLAESAYERMFADCPSLKSTGHLPFVEVSERSCYEMFINDVILNEAWPDYVYIRGSVPTDAFYGWLENVAEEGNFIEAPGSHWILGPSGNPWKGKPLFFEANNSGVSITLWAPHTGYSEYSYSLDNKTWIPVTSTTPIVLNSGDKLYVERKLTGTPTHGQLTITGGTVNLGGWLASMVDPEYTDVEDVTINGAFKNLFAGCDAIVNTDQLALTFDTISGDEVMMGMFRDCNGLKVVNFGSKDEEYPDMYTKTLGKDSYREMFMGCTNLTQAPVVSAVVLAEGSMRSMFEGCTSLVRPASVPATKMAKECFRAMYKDCTALVTDSFSSRITETADGCWQEMFKGCTKLAASSSIADIDMNIATCMEMYKDCTNISRCGTLYSTHLGDSCYESMFEGCTSLTQMPVLPAESLPDHCYDSMFKGDKILTKTTSLPAFTYIGEESLARMFYECEKLNEITCMYLNPGTQEVEQKFFEWAYGVAPLGTFHEAPEGWTEYDGWPFGVSGDPWKKEPLKFIANEPSTLGLVTRGNPAVSHIQYSYNCGQWFDYTGETLSLGTDDTIYFRRNIEANLSDIDYNKFVGNGSFRVEKELTSMHSYREVDGRTALDYKYAFAHLFEDFPVTDISGLRYPYTSITEGAFYATFKGCSMLDGLMRRFPATYVPEYGYYQMFKDCTSLTTAPDFAATLATSHAMEEMFMGCESLVNINKNALAAVDGVQSCAHMFQDCTSLVSVVPDLFSTTEFRGERGFQGMFEGCTSLVDGVNIFPTKTQSTYTFESMYEGCTSMVTHMPSILLNEVGEGELSRMFAHSGLATFDDLEFSEVGKLGCANMFEGCENLTEMGLLPCRYLGEEAYANMFQDCINLEETSVLPDLDWDSLGERAMTCMFLQCEKLRAITTEWDQRGEDEYTYRWAEKVARDGVFTDPEGSIWVSGPNGDPWKYPLYFQTNGPTTTIKYDNNNTPADLLQYSFDNQNWIDYPTGTGITIRTGGQAPGDRVYFRRNVTGDVIYAKEHEDDLAGHFTILSGEAIIGGNLMSMDTAKQRGISWEYLDGTTYTRVFGDLFSNNDKLTDSISLKVPMKDLAAASFYKTFENCPNLTRTPNFEFETAGELALYKMFKDCTSIASAFDIDIDVLEPNVCDTMFEGCTALVSCPAVNATSISSESCINMFKGCESLTRACNLDKVKTLAPHCYESMFEDCTSLRDYNLEFDLASDYSCKAIFKNTAVEVVRKLNGALAEGCYQEMFMNCSSITELREEILPAMILYPWCYSSMFQGCDNLEGVLKNILPAEGMAEHCYEAMFMDCPKLEGIEFDIVNVAPYCCQYMFKNDIEFKRLINHFLYLEEEIENDEFHEWCYNVYKDGEFLEVDDSTWIGGESGDPWKFALYVEAKTNGTKVTYNEYDFTHNLMYSYNNTVWEPYTDTITIDAGERVYFKATTDGHAHEPHTTLPRIVVPNDCEFVVGGHLSSLNDGIISSKDKLLEKSGLYADLFAHDSGLLSADDLHFDSTIVLGRYTYGGMFKDCSLTKLPKLVATQIGDLVYGAMFSGCKALTSIAEFTNEGMIMGEYAMSGMFSECENLTQLPEALLADLSVGCYQGMFSACKNLGYVPEGFLPKTELMEFCYSMMFMECETLDNIPNLPSKYIPQRAYQFMFSDCIDLREVKVLTEDTTFSRGTIEQPSQGNCEFMFAGCKNLTKIDCPYLYTEEDGKNDAFYSWAKDVADEGVFVASPNVIWVFGKDGDPWLYPLYFKNEGTTDVNISFEDEDGNYEALTLKYARHNSEEYKGYTLGTTITVAPGEKVFFTGTYNKAVSDLETPRGFKCTTGASLSVGGNINSMAFSKPLTQGLALYTWEDKTTLENVPAKPFANLFADIIDKNALVSFNYLGLPNLVLNEGCYAYLFANDKNLSYLPQEFELVATLLAENCYKGMFEGSSLVQTKTEILPLIDIPNSAYEAMFKDCELLTNTPLLPGVNLGEAAYREMFMNTKALKDVDIDLIISATNISDYTFESMFEGSALLASTRILARNMKNYACHNMFKDCESLITMNSLASLVLADHCYDNMFSGCVSLVNVSDLSADILQDCCYYQMFKGDTSLKDSPWMKFTMFYGDECCFEMFCDCEKLNHITVDYNCGDIHPWINSVFMNWALNVADEGNFEQVYTAEWPAGPSGDPWKKYPLTITPHTAGTTMHIDSVIASDFFMYSLDKGSTWNIYNVGDSIVVDEDVWWYRKATANRAVGDGAHFVFDGDVDISGEIMSMQNWNFFTDNVASATSLFSRMFYGSDKVYNIDGMTISTKSSSASCFEDLFDGCINITHIPDDLISGITTRIGARSMAGMFRGCTSLVDVHNIFFPTSRVIDEYAYAEMFMDCISLTEPSSYLPETLGKYSFYGMFRNCIALEHSPRMADVVFDEGCYMEMFYNCEKLNYVFHEYQYPEKEEELPLHAFENWCFGVAPEGFFYEIAGSAWIPGPSGNPWKFGLHFIAKEDGAKVGGIIVGQDKVEYSYDNQNWVEWDGSELIIGNVGDKLYFRRDATGSLDSYTQFTTPFGAVTTAGEIRSMNNKIRFVSELRPYCFMNMFKGCDKLDWPHDLSALDDLSDGCFYSMYENCSFKDLHTYALEADVIDINSYTRMFAECENLEKGPQLMFTELSRFSCYEMFEGCSKLKEMWVPNYDYDVLEHPDQATENWLLNVASTGTFHEKETGKWDDGPSANPWKVVPFYIEAITDGTFSINMKGTPKYSRLEYSLDGANWSAYTPGTNIQLVAKKKCYFRRDVTNNGDSSNYLYVNTANSGTASFIAGGCIESMYKATDFEGTTFLDKWPFYNLLGSYSQRVVSASKIKSVAANYGPYSLASLFSGNTSITTIPNFFNASAALGVGCFDSMFMNCTNLATIDEDFLPFTILQESCYANMFDGCTKFNTPLNLPAKTIGLGAYMNMFARCTSLEETGELAFETLLPTATQCCYGMFNGDSKLKEINVPYYNYPADGSVPEDAFKNWSNAVYKFGIPNGGDFNCSEESAWPDGADGNPWYLGGVAFIGIEPSSVKLNNSGKFTSVQYRRVKGDVVGDWTNYTAGSTLNVDVDEILVFRANLNPTRAEDEVGTFITTGNTEVAGRLSYMVNKTSLATPREYAFESLFEVPFGENGYISSAAKLQGGLTSLSDYCFYRMFRSQDMLAELPSGLLCYKTLARGCYAQMFYKCIALDAPMALPAMELEPYCYQYMYSGCEGFTDISSFVLPATELKAYCYHAMFSNCTNIEKGMAQLAADAVAKGAYMDMFTNDEKLPSTPMLLFTQVDENSCAGMFDGCRELDTINVPFYIYEEATLPTDAFRGWSRNVKWYGTPKGTFNCEPTSENEWPGGMNGNPWKATALAFTPLLANTTVTYYRTHPDGSGVERYSTMIDGVISPWIEMPKDSSPISVTLNVGDYVWFTRDKAVPSQNGWFEADKAVSVSGDLLSMVKGEDFESYSGLEVQSLGAFAGEDDGILPKGMFQKLGANLKDIKDLRLSAKIFGYAAFARLFEGCSQITEFSKTLLQGSAVISMYQYANMFLDCAKITDLTECHIVATDGLEAHAFDSTFMNSGLVKSPYFDFDETAIKEAANVFGWCFANDIYLEEIHIPNWNFTDRDVEWQIFNDWCLSVRNLMVPGGGLFDNVDELLWVDGKDGNPWPVECFYIENLGSPSDFYVIGDGEAIKYEYSTDYENWTEFTKGDRVDLPTGKTYLRRLLYDGGWLSDFNTFEVRCSAFNVGGYLESMVSGENWKKNRDKMVPGAFNKFLNMMDGLRGAEKLVFPNGLAENCYMDMFSNSPLSSIPEVLTTATNIPQFAFMGMFRRTRITEVPKGFLPEDFTVNTGSFAQMFSDCSELTKIDWKINCVTSMASFAFVRMFANCQELVQGPSEISFDNGIEANSTGQQFAWMFYNCSKLTTPVKLYAKVVWPIMFMDMYYGCSAITTADVSWEEISNEREAAEAFESMFEECAALTKCDMHGWLNPNTSTLAYPSMFKRMFYNCINLVRTPDILITAFAGSSDDNAAFESCFENCASLTEITIPNFVYSTTKHKWDNNFKNWVKNVRNFLVQDGGIFNCAAGTRLQWPVGSDGDPWSAGVWFTLTWDDSELDVKVEYL